uniref:Uncharacterized protein n=1 Tax=Anguilla anguilla TaxID=7936 RepID=A0A0E9XW83_ANGAN
MLHLELSVHLVLSYCQLCYKVLRFLFLYTVLLLVNSCLYILLGSLVSRVI